MLKFVARRFGLMVLTAICLTFIVFFLTNLRPNLEKLAKSEGSVRMSDESVQNWLTENGFAQPMLVRYGVGTAVVEETVLITDAGAETLSGLDW